jgi:hypothetical protein
MRYGATAFSYGWNDNNSMVQFAAHGRQIRFMLPLPKADEREYTHTPTGIRRPPAQVTKAWEQGCRARWRALLLIIKAKLEAVEAGITEFEDEFLSHVVLPDGGTAGQWLRPQIADAYESGLMPPMLPELGTGA